jgi:hypothetical protein
LPVSVKIGERVYTYPAICAACETEHVTGAVDARRKRTATTGRSPARIIREVFLDRVVFPEDEGGESFGKTLPASLLPYRQPAGWRIPPPCLYDA